MYTVINQISTLHAHRKRLEKVVSSLVNTEDNALKTAMETQPATQ